MNTNRLRIALMGLAGAVAGFTVQACTPQPLPECSVTITSAALGLAPYYVVLTKESATGTCGDIDHLKVGLQRFRTKASGGSFTVAVKASPVVDPYLGYTFSENVDDSNDCANEEDCQGADDPSASCVNLRSDGGIELNDGSPVVPVDADVGEVSFDPGDGGTETFEVELANECGAVPDSISRVDPADPDGKNLNAIGNMPQFPTAGVCPVTNFTGGVQNFQAEDLTLVGGATTTLPAVTYRLEFENFNVISTTKVPGTAFTSTIKYTEGACTATFKALGFWPEVHCEADSDCDPTADLDAGRLLGSGLNPDFKSKCDTVREVCVPGVDVTTLK
jgi:hypothetical protein